MGIRKTGWFMVFVVLLCALVALSSLGSRKAIEEAICGDQRGSLSWNLDEGTEELLWNYCEQDLIQMKEAIEDCDLCIPGKTPCSVNDFVTKSPSLAKDKIQTAMVIHHHKIKRLPLDCLIKKNLLLRFHGEEGESQNLYISYLESIFLRPDIPRRILISDLLEIEGIGETPVPAPAPAPSPYVQSPMLSPSPSPDSAPSGSQPPNVSPASSKPYINSSLRTPSDDLTSTSPSPGSTEQLTKKNSSHKSVVIAVAVTASATFVIVALLFLCYTKVLKNRRRQNDERPLLSLSLSDYSLSSSHKSFALGNPTNPEKIRNGPYGGSNTISSQNRKDSAPNKTYYSETGTLNSFLSQPLPPDPNAGMGNYSVDMSNSFNSNRTQVPPPSLKPPPGRIEISPPEVPSPEPFPSPFKANPPPPIPARPAPPAPSLKPASGAGPRPPGPPPPMPPKPPVLNSGPRPPPPPKSGSAPPRPPAPMGLGPKSSRPPPGPNHLSNSVPSADDESEASKAKLKPFFWDKVMANPDQSMVWHQIKSGSFQFNEEMIENLFGYAAPEKKNDNKKEYSSESSSQSIQLIDQKKAQNLAILLRAMNVTTKEVCDSLQEGNELPIEFLQTLLKMAPTQEEELKIRLFTGELSQLGPAERFLKAMVEIPFAFKRIESLIFMSSLQEEVSSIKESFATLEVACKELRNSRLFLKLLEAVLKTGNRMNNGTFRGGAQAFKLDTLLKLSDVKGTDGKTTLLHFVVQEIIRTEGVRAARTASTGTSLSASSIKSDDFVDVTPDDTEEHFRNLGLQVVSGLSSELENVKKVASLDADSISGTVIKLGQSLVKTRDFMNAEMKRSEEETGFRQTLTSFVQNAEVDIMWLLEEEKRIMALVKSTGDYFHGNAGKDDGLRLFVIVRDFLIMLDKSCKEVAQKRPVRSQKKEISATPSSNLHPPSSPDIRPRLFPAVTDRHVDSSSSDDD